MNLTEWRPTRKQKKLIKQVLKSGRLTYGPKTKSFESKFAYVHKANYAIFCSSGTAALKIAIGALKMRAGWKDGSEVIIPSVTFVATMNAVIMNNLKPVLVDVEKETANLDPLLIEKAITRKTVAIIPVHLLGQPANMPEIMEIAGVYDLEVIEDSCETFGVHSLEGTVSCFSTYITHHIPTGVGGMILTDNKKLATTMRSMIFHGRDESYLTIDDEPDDIWKRFYFPRMGYSDRATELEAALGVGGIESWENMLRIRQSWANVMRWELWDIFDFPWEQTSNHSFMFFPVYAKNRDDLMIYLEKNGVQTRTMMPLISQPITKPYLKGKYNVAKYIDEHGLLLPCHQYLKKKEVYRMIDLIKEFYA